MGHDPLAMIRRLPGGSHLPPGWGGAYFVDGVAVKKRRNMRGFMIAGMASFGAHLLLCGMLVMELMPDLSRVIPRPVRPDPPRMRLIPPPQPPPQPQPQGPNFIDTTGLRQEKPQSPTPNISAQDTALRSPKPGTSDIPMPTQDGVDKPGLTLVETPESLPMRPDQPQPPAPQTPPEKPAPPEPQEEPRQAMRQEQKLPEAITGILPRPMEGEDRPDREKKKREDARPEEQQRNPSAAPAPFEFKQDRTAIEGGMAAPGDASVDSQATPLGEYQAKVYRAIGSQWRYMVRQQKGLLDLGTVSIDFIVRRDGTLADLRVDFNTSSSAMLQTISENAIRLVAPFPPFPGSVREQVGDELPFDVKFTIY